MTLSVAAFVAGCNDAPVDYYSTDPGGNVSATFSVDDDNIVVESTVLEYDAKVKTNVWWKAVVEYPEEAVATDWCSVYPTEGYGDATIKVIMTRNIDEVERNATVKLIVDNGTPEGQGYHDVFVEQQASPRFIETNNSLYAMGVVRADTVVLVTANVNYRLEASTDDGSDLWISFPSQTTGSKGFDRRFTLRFATNTTGFARLGSFKVISDDNPELTQTVTVTQRARIFPLEITKMDNSALGLIMKWTTDPSFLKYDVIVTALGDPTVVVTTIPGLVGDSINLMDYPAVRDYPDLAIDAKVKGRTVDAIWDEMSLNTWSTNTKFGDGGGNGSSASQAFVVSNLRHFLTMSTVSMEYFYKQNADIDMTEWSTNNVYSPVGTNIEPFTGGYDGQNKKIIGIQLNGLVGKTMALWGHIKGVNSYVKNLVVDRGVLNVGYKADYVFDQNNQYTLVVGDNEGGTISNVHVVNPSITTSYYTICATVCGMNAGTVDNCSTVSTSSDYKISELGAVRIGANTWVGGVVGVNWVGAVVKNSANKGTDIYYETGSTPNERPTIIGGVVGGNDGTIESCYNLGNISNGTAATAADAGVGGICGSTIQRSGGATNPWVDRGGNLYRSATGTIKKSFNAGNITSGTSIYMGGITGDYICSTAAGILVEECYNSGTLTFLNVATGTTIAYCGGLAGRSQGNWKNCYNVGSIVANGGNQGRTYQIGGLMGQTFGTYTIYTNCYNYGTITKNYTATPSAYASLVATLLACPYTASNANGSKFVYCYDLEGSAGPKYYNGSVSATTGANPMNYRLATTGYRYALEPALADILAANELNFALGEDTGATLTAAQMAVQSNYDSSWDFTTIWNAPTGGLPPTLRNVPVPAP